MGRGSGPVMDRTGGVADGMSGSPVYVTGSDGVARVMGAVAYGSGDQANVIAGVTPIEQMIDSNSGLRANERGVHTVFLTCAEPPATVLSSCDVVVHVEVGPEVVTGSTRLKAGTATKLVLNIITTGAMVRIGKTYGNLMVDLQATNVKLRERGERIVMEVLGVSRETARTALTAAGGRVRTAIVMVHEKIDVAAAEARLAGVDHQLGSIVEPAPKVPPA